MISKLYCHQSEEEMGQAIDQFWMEHETFCSRTGSFQTSYIWTSYAIKYGKSYMWHNMYAKPFTKFLGLVGCLVTSKIIGIGPSESNWKKYKHVQHGQRSRLQSDSSEKQAILYGMVNMHKNSMMGTRCVYNWTNMMVGVGLDKIVHHDREPHRARIFNACTKDWESDILRTLDQENEQLIIKKYKTLRLLDDEDNQTYMIAPEILEFKGPTRMNKQYCMVGQPLNWMDGDNMDILISRDIHYYFMVLIKVVEQDLDLGVKKKSSIN